MTYTSRAHREGSWWIVQNDQFRGAISQVRRLDLAADAQREAIAFVAEVDQDEIVVVIRVELEPALARSLDEAVALRAEAEAEEKEARALSLRRAVAISLKDDGMTLRDIAVVLGVSYQRVHQLVREAEPVELVAS
ncbi:MULTISPECIES: sigma factor-like helix-turn-helix DNA-binding protein [unclassified Curtobacterium]|uniref:sigma factor-like helix-turn-helix DNA-binding protein n=1 Tax=unclassified Curtobacterium TaxID=257496 RepID=UPI000FA746A8|nr:MULTISPECIES: sigma factor-like helix-turn-helix DNA-binding protein [unclassified Curtobacterium]ROQ16816.1 sigma-70-like protein [Curtobacterium sp. PhB171]ROQ25107.1 sigma-70-like protein [Curtobacterium sp. PhB170]ROS36558.1 sigma-70-like protein [Curtobacterium sp. PhB131]ROS71236.1 sigma-70-like protein [Curtobacterium sp. PhB141]